jgi:uncharacterized membrane-anchored protein
MSLSLGLVSGKAALVAGAALLQVGILTGMIAADSAPLMFGETLRLKVVPVDPRDLFRGDYVVLGYDYSRVDVGRVGLIPTGHDWHGYPEYEGREVFITLEPSPDGKYWQAADYSSTRPSSPHYLRGTFSGWGRIECGIEAWYVQEGEGLRIEDAIRRQRNVYADVAVWKGTARLKDLVVE